MPNSDTVKDPYPRWMEPADKGDLVLLATRCYSVNTEIVAVLMEIINGDKADAIEKMKPLFREMRDLSKLIDEIGGRNVD